MKAPGRHRRNVRAWFLALAAFALALQVALPQGFMLGRGSGARGLVICTGHGALFSSEAPGKPGKAPSQSAGLCAFAAHGGPAGAPEFAVIARPAPAAEASEPVVFAAAAPGRGLAAPPPPSRGPPLTL
jgi:hypothetical protein